mmetsp:Transcript_6584/g.18909  ORF Transcript_6584/g.18909 Transcript_6584/m.18909 type:complete len:151 (-) Transcript_6584:1217-1669(-)
MGDGYAIDTMSVASKTSLKQQPRSTDEAEIADFLTSNGNSVRQIRLKILVGTYISLYKIGKAIRGSSGCDLSHCIDFAVLDKAHKMEGLSNRVRDRFCSTKRRSRSIKKRERAFSYGLYDSNIEIRNRLFMTGTPHNYPEKPGSQLRTTL